MWAVLLLLVMASVAMPGFSNGSGCGSSCADSFASSRPAVTTSGVARVDRSSLRNHGSVRIVRFEALTAAAFSLQSGTHADWLEFQTAAPLTVDGFSAARPARAPPLLTSALA
jgi:hypothetical protein